MVGEQPYKSVTSDEPAFIWKYIIFLPDQVVECKIKIKKFLSFVLFLTGRKTSSSVYLMLCLLGLRS